MRIIRIMSALAGAVLLSGCYTTAPLYSGAGALTALASKYACSEPGKEAKMVSLKENMSSIGGAWYEPDTPMLSNDGAERITFRPLSFGRYIISVDKEKDGRQFVFTAKIEDKRIDVFAFSTAETERWLLRKHGVEISPSGPLVGEKDAIHRFFVDVARSENVQLIYSCWPAE